MGAQAMLESYPVSRHLAEIKLAAYADGTTEMQNERIDQMLRRATACPREGIVATLDQRHRRPTGLPSDWMESLGCLSVSETRSHMQAIAR
jgi:hypothetical protein